MVYTLEQEEKWRQTISKAAREQGAGAPHVIEQSQKLYEQYFFEYFKHHIKKDNSKTFLLDAGCGTGKIAKKLAGQGFQVYGIDFSSDIISLAKHYAPQVNFQTSSLYKLPFPARMFDIVICLGLFQTVGDIMQSLQEISRVLKPGGVLIIRTPNSLSLGHVFLSKTIHFFNPYAFGDLLRTCSFKVTTLKGVYVFPPFIRFLGTLILKLKLFYAFNVFFPLFAFSAHSFYIEARKP